MSSGAGHYKKRVRAARPNASVPCVNQGCQRRARRGSTECEKCQTLKRLEHSETEGRVKVKRCFACGSIPDRRPLAGCEVCHEPFGEDTPVTVEVYGRSSAGWAVR